MATRKSKRLTLKKKARISKKVRDNFKKKNKETSKKNKKQERVPRCILMSNKSIEEIKKQKKELKIINEEYLKSKKEEKTTELEKYINETDLFIEVCDYRDIKRSRNREIENEIINKGKKLVIWLNYSNEIEIDKSSIENDGIKIIEDMEILNEVKKISIFGYPKSGKFYLKKIIENVRKEIEYNIISIKTNEMISISEILRGIIDEEKVDIIYFIRKLFKYIDNEKISEYYKIPYVTDMNKLLEILGKKIKDDNKENIKKGALQFIKDLKSNKIKWIFKNNEFIIKI